MGATDLGPQTQSPPDSPTAREAQEGSGFRPPLRPLTAAHPGKLRPGGSGDSALPQLRPDRWLWASLDAPPYPGPPAPASPRPGKNLPRPLQQDASARACAVGQRRRSQESLPEKKMAARVTW